MYTIVCCIRSNVSIKVKLQNSTCWTWFLFDFAKLSSRFMFAIILCLLLFFSRNKFVLFIDYLCVCVFFSKSILTEHRMLWLWYCYFNFMSDSNFIGHLDQSKDVERTLMLLLKWLPLKLSYSCLRCCSFWNDAGIPQIWCSMREFRF